MFEDNGEVDDIFFQISNSKNFYYLRMKTPNNNKYKGDLLLSPIIYYPIKETGGEDIQNAFNRAITYPSSITLDVVCLPFPPSCFKYACKVKEFFIGESDDGQGGTVPNVFSGDNSLILFNLLSEDYIDVDIKTTIKFGEFYDFNVDDYKLSPVLNEPMLMSQQCSYYSILDNKIVLPYYFSNAYYPDNDLRSNGIDTLRGYPYASFYLQLGRYKTVSENVYTKMYYPNSTFSCDIKIPFVSDVYNTYLLNNGVSMNTSLQLANEEKKLKDDYAFSKFGVGLFGGLATLFAGGAAAAMTGGLFGIGGIGEGIGSIASSGVDFTYETKMNEFNLKKVVAQQEAVKADLRNQVGDLKDAYAKGQLVREWTAHYFTIPRKEQVRVFTDIYFNGYIVNSVYKFNDYDNRVNFNYFELKNVFALCSQYLKLPKTIMLSITNQLEKGIRL